jgi:hypothetical protein
MDSIKQNIKDNPALVVALVSTLATVVVAFGVSLSPEQIGAIIGLVNTVLAIVFGKPVQAVKAARARR